MKRLFVFFMSLIFIMCLVGCSESKEKVTVDFIIDGESHLVQIDKGSSIIKDIIPLSNKEETVELYYDENMENKYNDETINSDTTFYVNVGGVGVSLEHNKLLGKAKKLYLDMIIKGKRNDATIDDVIVIRYLGVYNDSLVGIFIDKENCIFPAIGTSITIEDLVFHFSEGYYIMVFNNNSIFTLYEAYTKNILSYSDLTEIYNRYVN